MNGILGIATVPAITATVWILCYLVKMWINDEKKRIIPTIAGVTGAILGLATISLDLNGFIVGAMSGLAATGANELVKQLKKDITVDDEQ